MPLNRTRAVVLALAVMTPAAAIPIRGSHAQTTAEPSAEQMKLAREYLGKTNVDRASTLAAMRAPMIGMMQQIGITQPDRAQAVVQEAILPLVDKHFDDYLAIMAKNYASVLSADDLKAGIAFYDTPAGQHIIKLQPQLAQLQLTGTTQWMASMQPEMQARVMQVMQTHGWDKN